MSIHKNGNIEEHLIAYILSETNEKTSEEIKNWIAESEENRKQYEDLLKIWRLAENNQVQFDEQNAWKNVESRINKKKWSLNYWFRIAALFVVILGSIYLLNEMFDSKPDHVILLSNTEIKRDTLIDKSIIKLNQNSSLEIPEDFNEKDRIVTLSGEAYFNVKHHKDKTFTIRIPDSKVEVLGTTFNIKANPGDSLVCVFVESGSVRFSYLGNKNKNLNIKLSPGEKVIYNLNSRSLKKNTDAALNQMDIYWVNKRLVFNATSLDKVFTILESIYGIRIDVLEEEINQNLLTVSFEDESITQIMNVIAETFELQLKADHRIYKVSVKDEE